MKHTESVLNALKQALYDRKPTETMKGLYKAEVTHRRGPWRIKQVLKLAKLEWVARFNRH